MKSQLLFFFSALGVFNGFLVSVYLLCFNQKKRIPNYFLGLLLLMLSIRIGKSVYLTFNEQHVLFYLQIGLSACFMIGVMLYYYLKASLYEKASVPLLWKLHVGALLLFIVGVGSWVPYEKNPVFWSDHFIDFIYLVWGVYIVLAAFLIQRLLKKYLKDRNACATSELWLVIVFLSNVLIYLGYLVGKFQFYILGAILFSLVMYLLTFFLISKENRAGIFKDLPEKYGAKKIETLVAEKMQKKLDVLMIDQKLFTNPKLKLPDVAMRMNVTPHQLSQLLNDNLRKSFASFVNEYRVAAAKELLHTRHELTLEGIGYEVGFSSKSTFYATFKKVSGITPAQFKKDGK